jgi:K+ transporter
MRSAGNYIPPRSTALNIYIITAGVKLILALIVFVSALFVLRFKNKWRMRLNYALTVTIILLIATPLINYFTMPDSKIEAIARLGEATKIAAKNMFLIWSCFWSIIISSFFIYVIKKLSLGDIRLLFR